MSKFFTRYPCHICGKLISNCGFAADAHKEMHVRRGEIDYRGNYRTEPLDPESQYCVTAICVTTGERRALTAAITKFVAEDMVLLERFPHPIRITNRDFRVDKYPFAK